MPPLPPANGIARAVLHFLNNGEQAVNVLHFRQPGGVGPMDLAALGESLEGWHGGALASLQSNFTRLDQIVLTELSELGAPSLEYTTGLPNLGTITAQPMPNSVSSVASLRTALRGRSFRGRIYHVGLTEGQVNGNSLESATRASLETAYSGLRLLTQVGNPDFQLVVLSYYSLGARRAVPVATDVTSVSVDGRVDSQRRRLPR